MHQDGAQFRQTVLKRGVRQPCTAPAGRTFAPALERCARHARPLPDRHRRPHETFRPSRARRCRGCRPRRAGRRHRRRRQRPSRADVPDLDVGQDVDADQARRRHLRRERVLRPLLRHLPQGRQHRRRDPAGLDHAGSHLHRGAGHAPRHRHAGARPPARTEQPQLGAAAAAPPGAGRDLRPGPQLHERAEGLQRRRDGQVRRVHRAGTPAPPTEYGRAGPDHGLLRRQHRHRHLELRAALRHERQRLQHDLRPVHARRAQPRLGQTHGVKEFTADGTPGDDPGRRRLHACASPTRTASAP